MGLTYFCHKATLLLRQSNDGHYLSLFSGYKLKLYGTQNRREITGLSSIDCRTGTSTQTEQQQPQRRILAKWHERFITTFVDERAWCKVYLQLLMSNESTFLYLQLLILWRTWAVVFPQQPVPAPKKLCH